MKATLNSSQVVRIVLNGIEFLTTKALIEQQSSRPIRKALEALENYRKAEQTAGGAVPKGLAGTWADDFNVNHNVQIDMVQLGKGRGGY